MKLKDYTPDYSVDIRPLPTQEGGGYLATFPQLGLVTTGLGATREDALKDLLRGVPGLIETLKEFNDSLPEPENQFQWRDYNGRVTLRLPKMLHFQLDRYADLEGVSLNTLMTTILQSGVTALSAGCAFGIAASAGLPSAKSSQVFARDEFDELAQVLAKVVGVVRDRGTSSFDWSSRLEADKRPGTLPEGWQVQETA